MIAAVLALHAVLGSASSCRGTDGVGARSSSPPWRRRSPWRGWRRSWTASSTVGRWTSRTGGWMPSASASTCASTPSSALMLLLVAGIGVLVCVYAWSYFSGDKPGTARLAAWSVSSPGAMTGVVVSDHLLALFVFWELTSITSYLLIRNADRSPVARASALQRCSSRVAAAWRCSSGSWSSGSRSGLPDLRDRRDGATGRRPWFVVGLVGILVGAFAKSAQAPLGSWLPGAMVAPTPPVSAYLHSASMVKAGVYLIARPLSLPPGQGRALDPPGRGGGADDDGHRWPASDETARPQAPARLRDHDQLGFLVVLFGLGVPGVTQAGVVMLLAPMPSQGAVVHGGRDDRSRGRDARRAAAARLREAVATRSRRGDGVGALDGRHPRRSSGSSQGEASGRPARRRDDGDRGGVRRGRGRIGPHRRLLGALRPRTSDACTSPTAARSPTAGPCTLPLRLRRAGRRAGGAHGRERRRARRRRPPRRRGDDLPRPHQGPGAPGALARCQRRPGLVGRDRRTGVRAAGTPRPCRSRARARIAGAVERRRLPPTSGRYHGVRPEGDRRRPARLPAAVRERDPPHHLRGADRRPRRPRAPSPDCPGSSMPRSRSPSSGWSSRRPSEPP